VVNLKLEGNLQTQLTQKLALSPEMLQSLEILQLPLIELNERIEKELLENPALEIDEKKIKKKSKDERIENLEKISSHDDDLLQKDYFLDSSSANINSNISSESTEKSLKQQFIEGAIAVKYTLYDHLLWQLRSLKLNEKQRDIGETIISLIDDDGFFKYELNEVFPEEDLQVAKGVLEAIQLFDPPGVGSKGVREALLFQLESIPENKINRYAYAIVRDYFDLMAERKDTAIMKNLGIKPEELKEAFEFLSNFNPYPGRTFDSDQTKYVIPDAYVYKREGEIIVEINNDIIPPLTVSKYMEKIATELKENKKKENKNKEDKKYIIEKVNMAKKFIFTIQHRNESLFRLVLAISQKQKEFFEKGPKYLKPLTMKEIANEIGFSESTISRLASSKYIQTEWGLHEIKYFFSNAISKDGKSTSSSESVKQIIKEIIESEKDNKITDQKIVELLKSRGINIARRTVAKYRKSLDILSSHHRK